MTWMQRAIILVAALTPTYLVRFKIGGVPTTMFELCIVGLCIAAVLRAVFVPAVRREYGDKIKKIPRDVVIASGLFFLAGCISVIVAPSAHAALGIWRAYIVEAMAFGLVAWLHVNSVKDFRYIAAAFSITAAVVALIAIVQKFTGWGISTASWRAAETRRVVSVFGYPNAVALYLELVMPFFVGMIMIVRAWRVRMWYLFVLVISCAAIIFAQSSGAAAALVGTAWIFFVAYRRTRVWAIVVAIICAVALLVSPYKQKFADEFLLQGYSGQIRTHMWHETIKMLEPRWFVGAGLAGYQTRVAPYHELKHVEIYLYPHNLVLTLWSELGLLGLGAFGWIFGMLVIWMVRALRQGLFEVRVWAGAVIATLLIISIHGLVDIPYFKNDFSALFWLLVAMALQIRYTLHPTE